MKKPRILILSGYGLNSEEETKFAFDVAGGNAEIVHINDFISKKKKLLSKSWRFCFPGVVVSYFEDKIDKKHK